MDTQCFNNESCKFVRRKFYVTKLLVVSFRLDDNHLRYKQRDNKARQMIIEPNCIHIALNIC